MDDIRRILIIDDDMEFCSLFKRRLEANGYEVEVSYEGGEAFSKTKSFYPDLVLLDLKMQGVDGFEFLRMLRSDPDTSGIPVIVTTALGDAVSMEKAEDFSCDAYMVKPFTPEKLIDTIKTLIG